MRRHTDPDLIAFVKALARAQVARDIANLRAAQTEGKAGENRADSDLRAIQR